MDYRLRSVSDMPKHGAYAVLIKPCLITEMKMTHYMHELSRAKSHTDLHMYRIKFSQSSEVCFLVTCSV